MDTRSSFTDAGRRLARRDGFALAALDIDDTLAGPDGVVSPANLDAVAQLQDAGAQIVLASGRSHANMLPFHRMLGLPPGPIVSAQGAVVRDTATDTLWHAHTLPADALATVTRQGRARGFAVQHYALDAIYVDAHTRWTDYDQSRNAQPQRRVADLLADPARQVVKVIWLGDPTEVAAAVEEVTAAWAGTLAVTPTDPPYLEFAHADVSKAAGLAVVADRLGVARSDIVAFGDGNNDVPMLAWAGLGVAVGHARPSAQRAADLVGPPGDPDTALARAVALLLGDRSAERVA